MWLVSLTSYFISTLRLPRRHHHPTATSVSATTAKTKKQAYQKSSSAVPTVEDQVSAEVDDLAMA